MSIIVPSNTPLSAEPSERYLTLLGETAKVSWSELAPLYLKGALLLIAPALDLVSVAEAVSADDTQQVAAWASSGMLERMPAAMADAFEADDASLWAVVVAPWVLVQKRHTGEHAGNDASADATENNDATPRANPPLPGNGET